ncbi:Foie gras liver health family 1-domain-containing protein [Suillus clintonianus]|uniref:Foie gras liver health family 1-domain-containing protein n=1 Tax=Suillus clintonianus TaxID=1904413 RepID=UPI001B860288|nr:Foie gras liver health family 1-domain-containing protein [Suillus clintonianus]KAG2112115.1 Foie gras liver health family 1-domain-containing protein [Suillus clintonianus]
MFGSTAILLPRTKRWAEAKVLADAINVKITKLYLYNHEHLLALSHHNSHMRRFADFSRGWGIGEETFEYWSWMARQHRVLAELLEQGSNSSLMFPTNSPHSLTAGMSSTSTPVELDTVRALGLNPSHALQHPGHYYFMAARCTEARRERFLANEGISQGTSGAPGYAKEKKVDHLTLILEFNGTFLRHGAPITLPVVVASAAPKPKDPPSTPLIRKAIFKAPRQSPLGSMLDSVSSDSELSKAAEAVAGEMEERASQMHIPELFRSVAQSSAAAPVANAVN